MSVRDVAGRAPDCIAEGNVLSEFLDANGFNTQSNYRLRDVRSYREYMQPIHDNYTLAPNRFALYGYPRRYWTPEQARTWNATVQARWPHERDMTSGSDGESSWEWRWQEDPETWTHAKVKLGGRWQVMRDAFTADAEQHREWLRLADGRVISTRCSFCTFLHGRPKYRPESACSEGAKTVSVGQPVVPEDVAISSAKLFVQLRVMLRGGEVCVQPADVVRVGTMFNVIAARAGNFLKAPSSKNAGAFLDALDADHGAPGSASTPIDTKALHEFGQALSMHYLSLKERRLCTLRRLEEVARKMRKPEGWSIHGKPYRSRPCLTEVTDSSQLNGTFTSNLLESIGYRAPVFALAGGADSSQPSFTRGLTGECKCDVPWHLRCSWERQPWVLYNLPPSSGVRQAEDFTGSVESLAEHRRAACDQPLAVACSISHPTHGQEQNAPASGSAAPRQTAKSDLLLWTASDEEDVSSSASEIVESDGMEELVDFDKEGEESESESLDVDPVESGGRCHTTPQKARSADIESPEKMGPPAQARPRDVCVEVRKDGFHPSDVPAAWLSDVLSDDSSDDCGSEENYCNESEQ